MDSGYKCWWLCWKQEHILEKSTGKLILLGFSFILGRKFSASHDRKKATENRICTNDWTKIYTPSQNGEAPTCAEHSHILRGFEREIEKRIVTSQNSNLWNYGIGRHSQRKRRKKPPCQKSAVSCKSAGRYKHLYALMIPYKPSKLGLDRNVYDPGLF